MGIKHFFYWFRKNFGNNMLKINSGECMDTKYKVNIDHLLLDMNGLFHNAAQKIYGYGSHKGARVYNPNDIAVFKEVCFNIDKILNIVRPKKSVVLCVDGPAPLSKQVQQRQRRFMAGQDAKESDTKFDSNSITPGTKFMNNLSKYIDWYIRKKMSENNKQSPWYYMDVIFSNEKVPGEGEHKLLNFIRKQINKNNESFCIYGSDSDLIMLSLGTHIKNFYILRDDMYNANLYNIINIGQVYNELVNILKWDDSKLVKKYNPMRAIDDFIFICFILGNDFLPHIPGVDIIEGGIEFALEIYKSVSSEFGHLVRKTKTMTKFKREHLCRFMEKIGEREREIFIDKLTSREKYIEDKIYDQCMDSNKTFHIKKYRKLYYKSNFPEYEKEKICKNYLEGMVWILNYYNLGVPDWNWKYNYQYAPFSYNISKYIMDFEFANYKEPKGKPTEPFVQLLAVLPPISRNLLPKLLDDVLVSDAYKKNCPDKFNIDYNGKRQKWEGIPILPFANYDQIKETLRVKCKLILESDLKRNNFGSSFIYSCCNDPKFFKSYYGDFQSYVNVKIISF